MNPETLRNVLAHLVKAGAVTVTLTVVGPLPKGFPRGELLSVNAEGQQNRAFEIWRVLKWAAEYPEP